MQQTSVQKTKKIKKKIGGMNMFKKMKHIKNEKGLTLIELLAVIVILAIIAAIAIPAIGNIINNSKDKAILSEASNILAGAKLAHVDNACGDPDATTKVVTCSSTALTGYVDGITLATADVVTLNTDTKKWNITYSKFSTIKDKAKYAEDFTGTTTLTATEDVLNTNLKK